MTCTRSHPHDDMNAECEQLTAVARFNNRERTWQLALQEWRDSCSCGCDACVALIEYLGLESSGASATDKQT